MWGVLVMLFVYDWPRSFLGVDAAVRVDYRDFGPKTSRSGVFSKSSVTTHKFATTIRCVKTRSQCVSLHARCETFRAG